MRPFQILDRQGVDQVTRDCFAALNKDAPVEYREFASLLAVRWNRNGTSTIGLGGGQGCGKSTLCALVEEACAFLGDKTAILGIDDFYLTKAQRKSLGKEVHELLATRGPPGTHDIDSLVESVRALQDGKSQSVPVFDKGKDERVGSRIIDSDVNRVVVEGWCVGARIEPSSRLKAPINSLESIHDPNGIWRNWVNQQLGGPYDELRSMMDELVFIRVPDMASVRKWRFQQELDRPVHLRMNRSAIHRFVEHYERITCWMLDDVNERADVVVELDDSHQISSLHGLL